MLIALFVFFLLFLAFAGYTILHAASHGEWRRLEFFTFGQCVPPASREEVREWTGML